jgi:hypothetical protein
MSEKAEEKAAPNPNVVIFRYLKENLRTETAVEQVKATATSATFKVISRLYLKNPETGDEELITEG